MSKRRKKRRQPLPQLPRPRRVRDGEQQTPPAAAQATKPAPTADNLGSQPADRQVTGTILAVEREFIVIDVDGGEARVYASELMLDVGETPSQRYAVGDTFDAFVFQMEPDPESGLPQFSIRRATPYPDALNRLKVGTVVNAAVVNTYDAGIELDVDGVRGNALNDDLASAIDESPHDRYQPGDALEQLFIWQVNYDARGLYLSVRRNAPGYVEALAAYSVGDLVSGVVTSFPNNGGLWLDVDGVIGSVLCHDLALADGKSAQDRYAVGDTVNNLFIWQIDHGARDLALSMRRSAPSYVEALDAHSVKEIVSGVVVDVQDNGGLWLDVDGVIGSVPLWELLLADGEPTQDRYAVGDTVSDLFVWQVNHDGRDLYLSMRRNAPNYVDTLDAYSVGEIVSGIVTETNEWGIWLDAVVSSWIPASELALDEGESPRDRYADGDTVAARVWQIDWTSRTAILSVRRLDTDFIENQIAPGATIDGVVRDRCPGGICVLVAGNDHHVPHCELSLFVGDRPRFENGQGIRVVVLAVDSNGQPTALSHRRTLPNWQAEFNRLVPGVIVQDAQIIPLGALPPGENRAGIDLGPVTGFVDHDELNMDGAKGMMGEEANTQYSVVIESIDADRGDPIVSHDKFEERWRELAEALSVGDQMQAKLRRVTRDKAILDLGFGLLAELPREQLPTVKDTGEQRRAREGDTFTVRITDKDEEEYLIVAENKNQWLADLIAEGENLTCEFKAVFKGPKPAEPSKNREVYSGLPILRAMAGLMNRDGGHVLVGVSDTAKNKGDVIGWEASGFKSQNEITTVLGNLVSDKLTPVAGGLYKSRFEVLPHGSEVLVIECEPAAQPIFLTDSGSAEFPLRFDASTRSLPADKQHDYIRERFYGQSATNS